ncbi:MAG TPA: lactate racemase domain-containing protein [Armatimonadaceae bacterium]|nr:lactate racemase domain-containing protein [Armatimonadaceae bacterium]
MMSGDDIERIVREGMAETGADGARRVLVIVPDGTRTAPVGPVFRVVWERLRSGRANGAASVDVMVALGTHQPMTEEAICRRIGITAEERTGEFRDVRLLNHAWDDPAQLAPLGTIAAAEIEQLTGGLFAQDVPVTINRAVFDYDHLVIIGPVFPHEVVGFSGGNKYLFPGVSGPEVLNFFHWLGAVITSPRVMGHKWTPVRAVVDRAASLVPVPTTAFCLVVRPHGEGDASAHPDGELAGLFAGPVRDAWSRAADLSETLHIVRVPRPFHTVLACAPRMYDEIWVGAKCMYKLEPVVADGGELIIYAPHIHGFAVTHDAAIRRIGYHTRDYFLKHWDRFKDEPWGVLAHSTHVRGVGAFEDGVEKPRIRVTLATGIPEAECRAVNLGYRNPESIRPEEYAGREEEGVLMVPRAGEMLYRLDTPPAWARPQ